MSENNYWITFWVAVLAAFCCLCFCAKGCNDSDNEVYKRMIDKGCSRVTVPGGNHDWRCP